MEKISYVLYAPPAGSLHLAQLKPYIAQPIIDQAYQQKLKTDSSHSSGRTFDIYIARSKYKNHCTKQYPRIHSIYFVFKMKSCYLRFIIHTIILTFPLTLLAEIYKPTRYDSCTHTGSSTTQQIMNITSVLQSIPPLESSTSTMSCLKAIPPSEEEMKKWLENWTQQDSNTTKPITANNPKDSTATPFT